MVAPCDSRTDKLKPLETKEVIFGVRYLQSTAL